jgi:hypothetical protein
MRKEYIEPQMEVIDMRMQSMLCISGGLGGDAKEPGMAPELDEDLGEEDLGL